MPKKPVKPATRPKAKPAANLHETTLLRIAAALERLAPPLAPAFDETAADAFIWHAEPAPGWLAPVPSINAVPIRLLQGVERVRDILLDNTQRFARGLPANNALLWGARGMGKSSLVKAVHGAINAKKQPGKTGALALVEIHREDIPTLPALLTLLRDSKRRYVLFCDDLSFDAEDQHYKSLKAVLDGGIEGRPDNVILYATSNRRHLLPRDMMENEKSTAINPHEAVEEKVSLSDRFGLWLGFHSCSQEDFFAMLDGYSKAYGLKIDQTQLRAEAVEWSMTRGARSGRVAWQFIQDLAGRLGQPIRTLKS
ncbi:MAG: ATP-binding protein [Ferrovibrio sp.]|uniref:ATP-binding protein n=1 Tax=Ferrovibrio sp. TaxID=1917215 RepID=UPI00261A2565|nr:ATP-binding protein [Ferrovibrio sp.]MCW0236432.1 ATP-binding protein [Ferrovibrio sp.]